jgi:DNA-binding transcriptional regulator YhcF (GntR family)
MTEREEALMKAIRQFVKENGFAPTVRELAEMLDWGHGTAQRALEELARQGSIEKQARMARGYRIRGL